MKPDKMESILTWSLEKLTIHAHYESRKLIKLRLVYGSDDASQIVLKQDQAKVLADVFNEALSCTLSETIFP